MFDARVDGWDADETLTRAGQTKPVIDLAAAPVDAYETPDRIREAVHQQTSSRTPLPPADASTSTTPTPTSHPTTADPPTKPGSGTSDPSPDATTGSKPTADAPTQPHPGIHLWRSPHGRHYLVDHTGTHKLPRTA